MSLILDLIETTQENQEDIQHFINKYTDDIACNNDWIRVSLKDNNKRLKFYIDNISTLVFLTHHLPMNYRFYKSLDRIQTLGINDLLSLNREWRGQNIMSDVEYKAISVFYNLPSKDKLDFSFDDFLNALKLYDSGWETFSTTHDISLKECYWFYSRQSIATAIIDIKERFGG